MSGTTTLRARPVASRWWLWPLLFVALALIPALDRVLPESLRLAPLLPPIMVFAIAGLGLNVVTGFTGLLNLGAAAFLAIGAYVYAILTCGIYPFQIGFWPGLGAALVLGGVAGAALAVPTLRLRGDYLAVVTVGFGEIVQDALKNLDGITKGTQGINPLPTPAWPGVTTMPAWSIYLVCLLVLALAVAGVRNLRAGRIGRLWVAVREDELSARSMGVATTGVKLVACAVGAALIATAGALYAALYGSSGEPGSYNYQLSVIVLAIVILGGLGSVPGVLLGALIMVGFNSILLTKLDDLLAHWGWKGDSNVFASPSNWKYLVFGLTLIVVMRLRPEGLLPAREVQAELHHRDDEDGEPA
jgi:branched-chain amino acid transport system permease protein